MALVRDPRIRAREFGDHDLLSQEERKRNAWHWENALRRHNFVEFIGNMIRGVTRSKLEGGSAVYDKWIEEAKTSTKARLDEQKSRGKNDD